MGIDPTDDRKRPCELCERADAEVGPLCPRCAVRAAVDNGDEDRARAIAEDFGLPACLVDLAVRARNFHQLRVQIAVMRLAVARALATAHVVTL
jgi:hypothetical protein